MRYYLIYKFLFIVLFLIFFAFHKADATSFSGNYLWLELNSSFSNHNVVINQEINIYFGSFPDEKKGLQGLCNINGFYTTGKKDNQGREIFYALEIKEKETQTYVVLNPNTFGWLKVIVTAKEKKEDREYIYCAMISAFIPENTRQLFQDMHEPTAQDDFTGAFDVSIYRERVKEEFNVYRKRLFPLRMKIKFNKAPFSNRPIRIIDMSEDFQQITTAGNGDLVYFPKDRSDNRQNSENKFNADLVLMQDAMDNKIYICAYTVPFFDAITKKRDFSLWLGLIIFILSFITSFFLIHRIGSGYENL